MLIITDGGADLIKWLCGLPCLQLHDRSGHYRLGHDDRSRDDGLVRYGEEASRQLREVGQMAIGD